MFGKIAVLVIAPQLSPRLALRDDCPPPSPLDHRIEITRLLRRKTILAQPSRRDQQMRMKIRPLALALRPVRRMNVQLHGKPLRHKMLDCKRPRQLHPVVVAELDIGRQRQHDLARQLRVLAFLHRFRRIPQRIARRQPDGAPSGSSTS